MKKQILILFMALFAIGLFTANGQPICPTARVVDPICLPSDALHPIPGTPYTYEVSVPTPPGTRSYTWFVTQDQNFISGGVLTGNRETAPGLHIATAGTEYNNPPADGNIVITWKSFVHDPTQPVFVVINVTNTESAPGSCVTQNMKVYKIMPVNAFTLDLANVDNLGITQAGYGANIDRCVHDIVSATYQDATPGPEGVVYDFGLDTLFYVVTAANFSTEWLPSIQIARDVLGAGGNMGEIVNVGWARPAAFPIPEASWTAMSLAAGVYTAPSPVAALDPSGTVGQIGECIVIRVVIDHSTTLSYEGIIAEQISVAVDGKTQLALTTPIGDIHWSSTQPVGNLLCGLEDGYQFDIALQTLNPRPNIVDETDPDPADDFLPIEP